MQHIALGAKRTAQIPCSQNNLHDRLAFSVVQLCAFLVQQSVEFLYIQGNCNCGGCA